MASRLKDFLVNYLCPLSARVKSEPMSPVLCHIVTAPRQLVQSRLLGLLSNSTEADPRMLPQAVARWGSRGALLDEYFTLYKSRRAAFAE
jgi:hypothetical protein